MQDHTPTIVAVHTGPGGIPKEAREAVEVTADGLAGDGHNHPKHGTPAQAVCLIDQEDLDDLAREGFEVFPGATGENVTVRGLQLDGLNIGDRLVFSGGVRLELTKRRKPCYVLDAISPELKVAIDGRCGFYARVLEPGPLRAGETIRVEPASTDG
jgi:MOSC domain-containing protein YiiM